MSAASHQATWQQLPGLAGKVRKQLDYLCTRLQLAPEQQAAWGRFARAIERSLAHVQSEVTEIANAVPEQTLAAHDDMLTSNLEAVQAVRRAVNELRRSLTAAQGRILDQETGGFAFGPPR